MAPELPKPKVSIKAMVAEIDYELEQRAKVYPRIASSEPRRAGELELHTERMQAIRVFLRWFEENEQLLKQRLSY